MEPGVDPRSARVDSRSVLLLTLDSCRYDTFVAAQAPALKAVGDQIYRAQAASHFTYASHMAMWVGVTPGLAERAEPYLNPKFAKFFRISTGDRRPHGPAAFELEGRNIVEGFRLAGFRTIGTGALGPFNPETPLGAAVMSDFERSYFAGWPCSVRRQLDWIQAELDSAPGQPVFVFLNVGETHTPYWHEGASWTVDDNPCRPFQTADRRADCAERQRACLEYVDAQVAPLLERFADASVIVTADHGDCWGEDGIWEHSVSHPATLTVPLLFRVADDVDRARSRAHAFELAGALSREMMVDREGSPNPADPRPPLTVDSFVSLRNDLVRGEFGGEVVFVDPATSEYHSSGATGSCIIELMGDGMRVADIVTALIGIYNIDRPTCEREALAFLRALDEKRLLS